MQRLIPLCVSLFCTSLFAEVPDFKLPQSKRAAVLYAKAMEQAERVYLAAMKAAKQEYASNLETALKGALAAGNLEEANALKAEQDRVFEEMKELANRDRPSTPRQDKPVEVDPIVGMWKWFVGGAPVPFNPDGTMGIEKRAKWEKTGDRVYRLNWPNGATDEVTLSPDGQKLSGQNVRVPTQRVSGEKLGDITDESLLGVWKWWTGATLNIRPGGDINNGDSRWWKDGNEFKIRFADGQIATVVVRGDQMAGTSTTGNKVWGKKEK